MTDDTDFYAWLDGELGEPEASAMTARVAADPQLSALAEQHLALRARLSEAFAPIAAAEVPVRMAEAVRPQADVIDLAAARSRRRQWSVMGLAMAASLALGLFVGANMPLGGKANFKSQDSTIAASGTLDHALERQLASAGEQNGVRIGVSFKDRAGRYCRSFSMPVQDGLACRGERGWSVEGLVAGDKAGGDYRMAAGPDPALGAMIDSRIDGDPLDGESEARLAQHGWK